MAEITKELGRIPVSRGNYQATTEYYKDNIVQYKRSSYQVVSESPIIGVPPINDEDIVNNGWIVFAGTLSEASLIKSNTQDLSGNNVQENLNSAAEKLKELKLESIYDVSAHNNGEVFESLSAILSSSDLSTLIPTSVRHGGMNIRFIQSSDNKYVQYRLMTNQWSTTISDWQGVDDEPTAGSDNLVKSGGIKDTLIQELGRSDLFVIPNWILNGNTGDIGRDNTSDLARGSVIGGKEYVILSRGIPVNVFRIAFYTSADKSKMNSYSGTYISGSNSGRYSFIAPSNAKGVQISTNGTHFPNSEVKIYEKEELSNTVWNNKSLLSRVEDTLDGLKYVGDSVLIDTIINGDNGSIITNYSGYTTYVFNNLEPNVTLIPFLNGNIADNTSIRYAIYETANDPYSYVIGGNSKIGNITIPNESGKTYVLRISVNSTTVTDVFVVDINSIYSILTELSSEYLGVKNVTHINKQTKKYVNGSNGLIGDDVNSTCYYFKVTGNSTYRIKLNGIVPFISDYWRYSYAIYTQPTYNNTYYVSGINAIKSTEIAIPSNQDTYYIALSVSRINSDYNVTLDGVSDKIDNRFNEVESLVDDVYKPFTATNKVVWVGTSIPEGSQYPNYACRANGLECINNSLGSSTLCFSNQHPSTVYYYSGRCLTATVAELEALYRQDVTDGVITEAQLNEWKNYSYERSILPYIDGTATYQASMIVIDHGYNDRNTIESEYSNIENWNWDSVDRTSFYGAFRYLLNKIQEVNPFVKIVIGGYFTNQIYAWRDFVASNGNKILGKEITSVQTAIAEHYNISILKVWEHTQIANYYISNSSNYVSDFNNQYGTSYNNLTLMVDDNTPIASNGNISSLQLYCMDGIHPFTDRTGNANKRLNAIYSKLLKKMI